MLSDAELLERYAGEGLLLDSNLLLLFIVGNHDRSRVRNFKRLSAFVPEDYDLLLAIAARFRRLYLTPNVATEVSNLAGALTGDVRTACFKAFAETVLAWEELSVPSREAVTHSSFTKLGLTDAVMFRAAGHPALVLTTDFALSQRLAAEGLPVINFNHLRAGNSI